MEEIAHEIEKMVQEKDDLYRQLVSLLENERSHIVDMEVDALWACAEAKRDIALKIVEMRNRILAGCQSLFPAEEMDAQSFSLARLLTLLPFSAESRQRLKKLKLSIDLHKEEIAARSRDNQRHVREYLGVIDEIMAVAVEDSANAQYSTQGHMPGNKQTSRLIHAEV